MKTLNNLNTQNLGQVMVDSKVDEAYFFLLGKSYYYQAKYQRALESLSDVWFVLGGEGIDTKFGISLNYPLTLNSSRTGVSDERIKLLVEGLKVLKGEPMSRGSKGVLRSAVVKLLEFMCHYENYLACDVNYYIEKMLEERVNGPKELLNSEGKVKEYPMSFEDFHLSQIVRGFKSEVLEIFGETELDAYLTTGDNLVEFLEEQAQVKKELVDKRSCLLNQVMELNF